jgi:hypothetical protein
MDNRDITPERGAWMADIEKRAAKAAKPVATAKAPDRVVTKPAAKKPAPVKPDVAASVSPQPKISAPISAAAPSGIPVSDTKDATMETIQSITEKTKALFSGVNTAEFTEQAKGAMEKSAKMAEDMAAFGKGNIEALVESSKIAAKNVDRRCQDARRRQVADRVHEDAERLRAHRVRFDDRRGLALDRAYAQDVR